MENRRVFLIVLDSFGIGRQPDAKDFGDEGSNTLASVSTSSFLKCPNLAKMGLFSIDHVREDIMACRKKRSPESEEELFALPTIDFVPGGAYGRLNEKSMGKDTTIGHWEIAGIYSQTPLPVYPNGFPPEIISAFEKAVGRKTLCNLPYSGTDVISDFGKEQEESGALIVYTSADSVFQIAAHEKTIPVSQLYEYCEIARKILSGRHAVGRVIARPFDGVYPNYFRTVRRHDFSLVPPQNTLLDLLIKQGAEVIGVGKINDIFAGRGLSQYTRTSGNADGIEKLREYMKTDFTGLCFVNLVDFDMLYGHRNDISGYAEAITAFDTALPEILSNMRENDLLMITADHGCDPGTPSTDHSRESVPILIAGQKIRSGVNLHTRTTFSDISATIAEYLGLTQEDTEELYGTSFLRLFFGSDVL